jgi:hypothetical protein
LEEVDTCIYEKIYLLLLCHYRVRAPAKPGLRLLEHVQLLQGQIWLEKSVLYRQASSVYAIQIKRCVDTPCQKCPEEGPRMIACSYDPMCAARLGELDFSREQRGEGNHSRLKPVKDLCPNNISQSRGNGLKVVRTR